MTEEIERATKKIEEIERAMNQLKENIEERDQESDGEIQEKVWWRATKE